MAASAGGNGRRQRLDPVEVDGVGDPARGRSCSSVAPHRPAVRHRNRGRRPGSSRPRSMPTLMYSSPVADSIERVRAVWTDAQQTISGKTSPTIRRSQTNSAHGPTSAANGADVGRPGARRDPGPEQHDLERDDREQAAGEQDERRLGELRASRGTSGRGSSPRRRRRSPRSRPPAGPGATRPRAIRRPRRGHRRPGSRRRRRPPPTRCTVAARRPDPPGDEADHRERRRTATRAARRGASQAGSTHDRRGPERGRQGAVGDPGEEPEADRAGRREAAGSRASPTVRRRSRTTAAYDPSASPVSTVQLMKARFVAIWVAGTARV